MVATSIVLVRRRIGYRTWHALHLAAYVAIGLAFSHQLATGQEFQRQPVARAYWWALYGVVVAALVWFRIVVPVARSLRHDLRVERVVQEAPGVVSIEIGGRDLAGLGALAGQSLRWRFLARGTGPKRTRSRSRRRPTAGACASRSSSSATTRRGWRRSRPGRG